MGTVSVTVTSDREYTIPEGYVEWDARGMAKGGAGGGKDDEHGGAGGGEGGKWFFTKMQVTPGWTFNLKVNDAIVAIEKAVENLTAYSGGQASGTFPGTGGSTSQNGFSKGMRNNGANGQSPPDPNGGNGGGASNGGTPTQPPGGGSYGQGGGGQGKDGPQFSPSQAGGPGGPPIIMLTLRDVTT